MKPATCVGVVGLDYGDEGKGKIINLLAPHFLYNPRGGGADNAGHTSQIGAEVYKLSLIPSGVMYPNVVPVLGHMMAINPEVLLKEIDSLENRGVSTKNLVISSYATTIMEWHLLEDGARESSEGGKKIGTTKRGVGPAYKDLIGRYDAIRIEDLIDEAMLREKIKSVFPRKKEMLEKLYGVTVDLTEQGLIERYTELGRRLKPFVRKDVSYMLNRALNEGDSALVEGAQGTLLGIFSGSFPNVTSSVTTVNGLCEGTGIPRNRFTCVLGVTKGGYITRVGGGPLPTQLGTDEQLRQEEEMRKKGVGLQLTDEDFEKANAGDEYYQGKVLRLQGNEFGTRTGRPRRTGRGDLVGLNYSIMINGVDALAMMKIDVLSGLDKIKLCVGYTINGETTTAYRPGHDLEIARPVYKTLDGWGRMSRDEWRRIAKREEKLPSNAKKLVTEIEKLTNRSVVLLSVGPDRDDTIQLKDNIF